MALPVMIQPMCAHKPPSFGECGSPSLSAVGQQPVITHADAHASGQPPQENRDGQVFPAEHEQCRNGADVESQHEKRSSPIQRLLKGSVSLEDAHGPCVLKNNLCSNLFPP